MSRSDVSFLFDLDGKLVDSVCQHVQACIAGGSVPRAPVR